MKKLRIILLSILLLVLTVAIAIYFASGIDIKLKSIDYANTKYGIDISHHQNLSIWKSFNKDTLNIAQLTWTAKLANVIPSEQKRIPIDFIYIKASQSSNFIDPEYKNHAREAHKRGIDIGLYHYYSINTSPEAQFRNFSAQLNKVKTELPPVIDFEDISQHVKSLEHRKKIYNDFKKLYDLIKNKYNVEPIVYTNCEEYIMFFKDKDFKLWIPWYNKDKHCIISQFTYIELNDNTLIDLDIRINNK